jgi:hypothetical protein
MTLTATLEKFKIVEMAKAAVLETPQLSKQATCRYQGTSLVNTLSDCGSDFAVIALSAGKVTIVDRRDFEWLSQWKWHFRVAGKGGYAARCDLSTGQRINLVMHREGVSASLRNER